MSRVCGLVYAQCSFAGFGECGRMTTVIMVDGEPSFWSGCLRDKSLDEIVEYINNDDQSDYFDSHVKAVNFLLDAVDYGYRI